MVIPFEPSEVFVEAATEAAKSVLKDTLEKT